MNRLLMLATLAAALVGGTLAFAQNGPDTLPTAPTVVTPGMSFKMERNANSPRGQEFIRFLAILGTHELTNADGTVTISQSNGPCYQRIDGIDRIVFDHGIQTVQFETSRVHLKSGGWYVVAGGVDELWARLAEAGPYEVKPAMGEKE